MNDIDPVEAWLEKKWGKFSGSEIWKLTIGGKEDKKTGTKSLFGDGAMSYIKKIAVQAYTLFNLDDNPETFQMKLGKAREHISAAYYQKLISFGGIMYYGGLNPLFEPYTADSGCSPDIVVWKDYKARIASWGAELKNPSSAVHMEYLLTIKDAMDLKRESIEYYSQCQFAMMTFKTDLWHWCSHNEYFPDKSRMLLIEVPQDKNFQNDLDARIEKATKLKYEFIEKLKNRK